MDGRTCYLYGQVAVLGEFGARGTGAGRSTPHRIIMMASIDMATSNKSAAAWPAAKVQQR